MWLTWFRAGGNGVFRWYRQLKTRSAHNPLLSFRSAVALAGALAACAPASAFPQPVPAPVARQPAAPRLETLRADAERLLQPDNDARLQALRSLLRERGLSYELQPVPNTRPDADPRPQGHNVILSFGAGEREIILGAHFDAVWLPGSELSAGMVDNAAAVAILARVADAIRAQPLRHRVRIVFFDLEEVGLLGSRRFVAAAQRDRIAAMINVDVAAYGDALMFGPADHPGNEDVYASMWFVCAERRLTCMDFPQYPPSDDRSFQAAGIPNISIGIQPRVGAHQLWLLLNGGPESGLAVGFVPAILGMIHTPDDQAERLEPDGMLRVYDAVLHLLLRLDRELP